MKDTGPPNILTWGSLVYGQISHNTLVDYKGFIVLLDYWWLITQENLSCIKYTIWEERNASLSQPHEVLWNQNAFPSG